MLALPLLLALAVTADPPASPAAEEEGPQELVAGPELPGDAPPPPPAAPFVLEGFQAPERIVAGAVLRLGGSSRGLDGGLDVTMRHRGFIGGASTEVGLRDLGLMLGYGHARGLYRGEALVGWGVAADIVDEGAGNVSKPGHFRSLQVGVDRALRGGEGWRASLGLGLWYRDVYGLATQPTSHSEVGVGLRFGIEAGW
jgi:hypothetical protein